MEDHRKTSVFCHKGFAYYTRRTKGNIRYLVCKSNREYGCKASAKLVFTEEQHHDIIMINADHNHDAPESYIGQLNFKEALKDACLRERGELKSIYEKIAGRFVTTAVHVPYNVVRSSMSKWRRLTTPSVPQSLVHLGEILNSGEWPKYTNCNRGPFFSGTVLSINGDSAIAFGNPEFIRQFTNAQYVFIDGTFKSVPRKPHFSQILTIFATCMDHAFPLVHIFMENRTRKLYDAVFDYVKATFPNFVNQNIMTDYESALVESLRSIYPHATVHGCFFHYCQAVFRKARALGIVKRIGNNQNGQLLLQKYYALPLLPAEMIVDILPTLQQDVELANLFRDLYNYVHNFWISRITPQRFSVFDQRHRTNNVMESYHRRLNSKLVRHPNVWDLMDTLINIQNTAILEFAQLERGKAVFRVASKNILFHSRLRQAWAKVSDGRFTAEDFLRQAVHFTEGLHKNLHFWDRNADDATNLAIFRPDNTNELHLTSLSSIQTPLLVQPVIQNDPPPLLPLPSTSASSFQTLLSIKNPPLEQAFTRNKLQPLLPLPSTTYFQMAPSSISQPIRNEPPPLYYFHLSEKSNNVPAQPAEFALQNGLIFNSGYYINNCSRSLAFKIGKFTYLDHTINLTSSDFNSLLSDFNKLDSTDINTSSLVDRWLSDYVIDCSAFSFLRNIQNIYYVDTISAHIILNKNSRVKSYSTFSPFVQSLEGIDYILLPYNVFNSHWALIVLGLRENKIYILNPGRAMPSEEETLQNINQFFVSRDKLNKVEELSTRNWSLEQIPHYPKQDDSHNCGVYVIYYIMVLSFNPDIKQCFLDDQHNSFNPEAFRITLQNILLSSSNNVFDECLVCGVATSDPSVECSICKRWLHYNNSCSKLNMDEGCLEKVAQKKYLFICPLCKNQKDPFKSTKDDQQIKLNCTELRFLVIHYRDFLINIYENRESNDACARYIQTKDPLKHLKWDYFVTFINFETATDVAKLIIHHTKILDKMFVSFVLLGIFLRIVINKYYGLSENEPSSILDKYRQLHDIEGYEFDYPSPYTLDEIFSKL